EANFRCPVYNGKIEDFIAAVRSKRLKLPPIDVVIGGPPCQGFSPLGKMSAKVDRKAAHDSLNGLWAYFAEALALVKPKAFMTENVPEFLATADFRRYLDAVWALG